ncbi:MAG: AsnC family transcriptional regulator [Candidatus Woesearchaeota archaeon]|jgi:DNA-binding Lrp family transcriptional regulator
MRVLVTSKETVKLDLIDRKILFLLSKNARFSYSTISKYVNLSRESVKQRILKMSSQKVILGFRTVVDVSKLGYSSYHLFIQTNNPKSEKEQNFVNSLILDPDVNALLKYNGKYDFEIAYMLKNVKQIGDKINFLSNYDLKDYELSVILSTLLSKSYPKSMMDFDEFNLSRVGRDGSFHSEFSKFVKNSVSVNVDDVDISILRSLCDDSRISMIELSTKVNTSIDTVIYRIKKMIALGLIVEFRPVINYAALGFSVYCVFFRFKNFTREKEAEFSAYVKEQKNFLWSCTCIGKYNNLSYIIVKDTFEFQEVLQSIREKFCDIIDVYEMMLSFVEYKYTYFPHGLMKK